MERLTNYILSPSAISMLSGSSKGTQAKYYDKGYWYKTNTVGSEGTAEYLASLVLACSNIEDYVEYERCTINNKPGCRSKNFLAPGESYISIQRLYELYMGGQLTDHIYTMSDVNERIKYVVDFVKDVTGLDIYDYLSKMLSFDALILNTDRHFHNIGIICNTETDEYRLAPIFDNGNSLLSNHTEFPFDVPLEENIEHVIGKPFAANLEYQAHCFGYGLKIDYEKLRVRLASEPDSRCLKVLCKQLGRYEKIFSKEIKEPNVVPVQTPTRSPRL